MSIQHKNEMASNEQMTSSDEAAASFSGDGPKPTRVSNASTSKTINLLIPEGTCTEVPETLVIPHASTTTVSTSPTPEPFKLLIPQPEGIGSEVLETHESPITIPTSVFNSSTPKSLNLLIPLLETSSSAVPETPLPTPLPNFSKPEMFKQLIPQPEGIFLEVPVTPTGTIQQTPLTPEPLVSFSSYKRDYYQPLIDEEKESPSSLGKSNKAISFQSVSSYYHKHEKTVIILIFVLFIMFPLIMIMAVCLLSF